jgi:hypothetical protein
MSSGSPVGNVTGVEVDPDHVVGCEPSEGRQDEGTDVATLRGVPVVAEPFHQYAERGGGASVGPAGP